jgi:hypothetical protein
VSSSIVEMRYETGRIRESADIVAVIGQYVSLRKSGTTQFAGLCPFHTEKTPSFYVHPVKGLYHCHGCGAAGDVFSFIKRIERVDFLQARAILAERAGIQLSERRRLTPEEKREFARKGKQAGKEADQMLVWRDAMVRALRRERDRYLRSYHDLLHVKPCASDDEQGWAHMALASEACYWLWTRVEDLDHRIQILRKADPSRLLPFFRGSQTARRAVAA